MEGALKLIMQYMESNPGIEINAQIANALLKELAEDEKTIRRLSVEEIMKAVCSVYDVNYSDMTSSNRTQPLATARQVAMFISVKLTGKSLPTIGEDFKRNHTTVLHGAQSIQKRLDVETELKRMVEQITEKLGRKPSEVFY
jgi:chromosomal replication initiator protein